MASFRDFLVQHRVHTAALTVPGTVLGAWLADPGQASWRFVGFGVFALLCHASGFLVNGLLDLRWDRVDPSKSHFPLVSGRVSEREAWLWALVGSYAAFALGAFLAGGSVVAVGFLFSFALAGSAYNACAKVSLLGPLMISASFASLPLFAWTASGGGPSWTAMYLGAFSFVMMVGQIAVSGYAKELGQEGEVNALRALGARATPTGKGDENEYVFPWRARTFAWACRGPLLLGGVVWAMGSPWFWVAWCAFMGGAFAWFKVLEEGKGFRSRRVFWMGVAEILAWWLLVASLGGVLGTRLAVAFMLVPVAWYVGMNRVMFGRWSAPRV